MDIPASPRPPATLRADPDGTAADPVLAALAPWRDGLHIDIVVPIFEGLPDVVVQILHPFEFRHEPLTWTEAAARVRVERSRLWPDRSTSSEFAQAATDWFSLPQVGRMHETHRPVLVEHLATVTAPGDAHYLIWQGWGIDWPGAAEVELEQRPCVLLSGPLHDFAEDWFDHEPPQVCWPDDLGWAFASDTDLPFTYVAGPEPLLQAIHADPRLETGLLDRSEPTTAIAG